MGVRPSPFAHACDTCALAKWKVTATGRLHPDKSGRCMWEMPKVSLPRSRQKSLRNRETEYVAPERGIGWIGRSDLDFMQNCPTWQPKEEH